MTIPVLYAGLFERVAAGSATKRDAIKAKCLECVGYVRADVTTCAAAPGRPGACPLWRYRPYVGRSSENA